MRLNQIQLLNYPVNQIWLNQIQLLNYCSNLNTNRNKEHVNTKSHLSEWSHIQNVTRYIYITVSSWTHSISTSIIMPFSSKSQQSTSQGNSALSAFSHSMLRHLQADMHFSPFFRQLHEADEQAVLQPQRTTLRISSGATGKSVVTGTKWSPSCFYPQLAGKSVWHDSVFHSTACKCTRSTRK